MAWQYRTDTSSTAAPEWPHYRLLHLHSDLSVRNDERKFPSLIFILSVIRKRNRTASRGPHSIDAVDVACHRYTDPRMNEYGEQDMPGSILSIPPLIQCHIHLHPQPAQCDTVNFRQRQCLADCFQCHEY